MKKLIHQLVLGVLSLSIAWGSLGWFSDARSFAIDDQKDVLVVLDVGGRATLLSSGSSSAQEISSAHVVVAGDTITADTTGVRLTFPGGAEARLAPKTAVQFFSGNDALDANFHLLLQTGEVWVSAQGAPRGVDVFVLGGVVAYASDDAVNILYEGNVVDVFSARNSVRVGFFLPVAQPTSTISLLNSVLVTEGSHLTIALSKIQPKLEKLLYSKLVKEFQYGPVSTDSIAQNTWFQANFSADTIRRNFIIQRLTELIKDNGLQISDPDSLFATVADSLHDVRTLMTFDPRRREQRRVDDALVHLDDAIYSYATSQQDRGDARMQLFRAKLQEMDREPVLLAEMSDALWNRFQSYAIFTTQDGSLYRIRSQLRDSLLGLHTLGYTVAYRQASELVRSYLYDIYESLHYDDSVSGDLLTSYFTAFNAIFSRYGGDIVQHPSVLAEENQLITQLYLKDPVFYKGPYFQSAFDLQSQWLSLLPEGRERSEENQTLVASKIQLMKRLRLFFFDDKVTVKDANTVLFRLLSDISGAIDQTETAVAQYFKQNLDTQQDFWQYLNSGDYTDSTLYGATQKERFTSFLENKKDNTEIATIQQDLLGTLSPTSPESKQTLADIQTKFMAVGVKNLKIAPLLDKDQSDVFVESAEYNSIPFSAIYDRDKNLISDIKVYSNTILSAAVPLDKIKNVFTVKTQDPAFSSAPVDGAGASTPEDRVEKVAKLFLAQKLQQIGFTIEASQIQTLDYPRKLFQITGAKLPYDKSQITVDFVVDLTKSSLTHVEVLILTNKQSLAGSLTFDSVVESVQKFYDQQFYLDIQKK